MVRTDGTLQELLQMKKATTLRPQRQAQTQARPSATASSQSARRLFLLEFESCGELGPACEASGCTLYDVRHWRSTDPMFARDFVLAAVSHVNKLKRTIEGMAGGEGPLAQRARELLAGEMRYIASDGRLDLRAWRDALKAFLEVSRSASARPVPV